MKKLLPFLCVLGLATGSVYAQTTTSATTTVTPPAIEAAAGLTPESSFYFLDKIAESLQELFAFTPDAKVKLQLQFAAERVAEAKAMLATAGDHTKGLEAVKTGLVESMQKTATVLQQEKAAGKDVTGLAKEANTELDVQESDLNSAMATTQKEVVDTKIEESKKLLEEARTTKDEAKIGAAEQDLKDNQQLAEDLKAKRKDLETTFHTEKKAIEDEMSLEDQAEDQAKGENENEDASSTLRSQSEDGHGPSRETRVRDARDTQDTPDTGDQGDNHGDQGGEGDNTPDGRN